MWLFKNKFDKLNRDDVVDAICKLEKEMQNTESIIEEKQTQINSLMDKGRKEADTQLKLYYAKKINCLKSEREQDIRRVTYLMYNVQLLNKLKNSIDDNQFFKNTSKQSLGNLLSDQKGLAKFLNKALNTRVSAEDVLTSADETFKTIEDSYSGNETIYGKNSDDDALLAMFDVFSSKGHGIIVFTLLYVVYVIGYTVTNITAQTLPAIMTNDPKQRPTIGVWQTAFNYLVPMIMTVVLNMVLLPKFGGTYNQDFLSAAVRVCMLVAAVGTVLVCIGISAYDKPEYYLGIKKQEPLRVKDMLEVLKGNKPLQAYIAAQASDKIAQQTASQAVITTMLFGIIIGDMSLATMLSVISMLPSIVFAGFGAKYAGKYGSKNAIVTWTKICMVVAVISLVFFIVIDPNTISSFGFTMIAYVVLTLILNGAKMCVTTADVSFMADIVDYELDRSGRYVPAVITGTYSLIDKLISSLSALIATGAVAIIGYTKTMPQPNEPLTTPIFVVTMIIYFGLPLAGWLVTLIAMKGCKLTKEEMIEVQKRIETKKKEMKEKTIKEYV